MGHRVGRQRRPIRSRGHERRLFPELNNATEWLPLRRPESRPLATIVPLANEIFLFMSANCKHGSVLSPEQSEVLYIHDHHMSEM